LEAISRGAKEVCFIEKDKIIAAVAQKNIENCGFEKKCRVLNSNVRSGLYDLFKKKCKFDIVFADPPYNKGLVETTIKLLQEYPVFKQDALIVVQHSTREDFGSVLLDSVSGDTAWQKINQRKYGDNAISFIKME
jgi:16S rRNA (guanine(966)-N(2))-methyltransferase RsmD